MSFGPIYPSSIIPITADKVWCGPWIGNGPAIQEIAIGVMASLDADAIVRLVFPMPVGALPSGTCKLRLISLANATANAAKVNPKWGSCAVGEDPSADITRTAEGTTTVTWSSDAFKYKENKITLDADTPVHSEFIVMDLTFETSGWTLAAISYWIPSIIWE